MRYFRIDDTYADGKDWTVTFSNPALRRSLTLPAPLTSNGTYTCKKMVYRTGYRRATSNLVLNDINF
jgi:hypothetical protein